MKKIMTLFVGVIALAAIIAPSAQAATFFGAENYTLPSGDTVANNLYAGGGNVSVYGTVNGDVFTGGGTITTFGQVKKDLFAAGGNLNIGGEVGDDLRVAGGSILINSQVNGETMAAGGMVTISPEAVLNGDVYLAGGTVVVLGAINGNLTIRAETVELNGTVAGNVNIQTIKLTVNEGAVVQGVMSYKTPTEVLIPATARMQGVHYEKYEQVKKVKSSKAGGAIAFGIFKLLSMLIIVAILYTIFKKGSSSMIVATLDSFWKKVLTSFIVLVVTPIAGILIAITIVGLPVTLMLALIYILFLILASLGAGPVFGTWLYSLIKKNKEAGRKYEVKWKTVLGGVFVLGLIAMVPVIGWLVSFIFWLAVLGQLFWNLNDLLKAGR